MFIVRDMMSEHCSTVVYTGGYSDAVAFCERECTDGVWNDRYNNLPMPIRYISNPMGKGGYRHYAVQLKSTFHA